MIHQWLSGLVSWQEAWPHGTAFAGGLLKSSAVVVLAWMACALLRRRSACVRNWVWRTAFIALLLLAFWQWNPRLVRERAPSYEVKTVVYAPMPLSPPVVASVSEQEVATSVPETTPNSVAAPTSVSASEKSRVFSLEELSSVIAQYAEVLLTWIWLGVAGLFVVWSVIRIVAGRYWLRRQRIPGDEGIHQRAVALAMSLRIKSVPRLYESAALTTPILMGWFKPEVYLPEKSREWNERKLNSVLLHELAHWRRADGWWQMIGSLATAFWWWNPLAWFALRQLKSEAEEAADDLVVLQQGEPYLYAQSLVEIASESPSQIPAALAIPMLGELPLEQRVRRILKQSFQRGRIGAWGAGVLVLLTVVMAVCIGCRVSVQKEEKLDPHNTGKFTVKVLDEEGKPVEGVVVQPWDLFSEKPDAASVSPSFQWYANTPNVRRIDVKTNAQGEAELIYPKILSNGMPIESIIIYAWHPDYCVQMANIYVNRKDPVSPLILYKGTTVTVDVEPIKGVSFTDMYVQSFGQWTVPAYWSHMGDYRFVAHIKEPERIGPVKDNRLPIRVVGVTKQGRRYFSETSLLSFSKKEAVHFSFQMRLGRVITGAIDPSVPRPVKNGRIGICVRSAAPEETGKIDLMNYWTTSTDISKDGRFSFEGLPEGRIELVATCDGYASTNILNRGESDAGVIPMQPTGKVRIRVKTEEGKAIADTLVSTGSDIRFGPGSEVIQWMWSPYGYGDCSGFLREWTEPTNRKRDYPWGKDLPYSKNTNSEGWALIENIPVGKVKFNAGSMQRSELGFGSVEVEVNSGSVAEGEIILKRNHSESIQSKNESATTNKAETSIPVPPMRTITVKVLDPDGSPVASAVVQPIELYSSQDPAVPPVIWKEETVGARRMDATSDVSGRVQLSYPMTLPGNKVTSIGCYIWQPDFVVEQRTLNVSESAEGVQEIRLDRGTSVTVEIDPIAGVKFQDIWVQTFTHVGRFSFWSRIGENRVRAHLSPSQYPLRVVAKDEAGNLYFSNTGSWEIPKTGDFNLRFQVMPGRSVTGALDASVPRPVKNGRILANISMIPTDYNSVVGGSFWMVTAPITEDGTFTLQNVPEGNPELVGICDGFISPNPQGKSVPGERIPLRFDSSRQSGLVVAMEPSGSARVKVVNEDGAPAAGVNVGCVLKWMKTPRSSGLGYELNMLDVLDAFTKPTKRDAVAGALDRYQTRTDANGVALLKDLPQGSLHFWARHPSNLAAGSGKAVLEVVPGKTVEAQIVLKKNGDLSADDRSKNKQTNLLPPATPLAKLKIPVVDENGKPIQGARFDPSTISSDPNYGVLLDLNKNSLDILNAKLSDARGNIELTYPAIYEGQKTLTVSGSLSHPDFLWRNVEVSVNSTKPLILHRGGFVIVHYQGIPGVNLGPVFVDVGEVPRNGEWGSQPIPMNGSRVITRAADGMGMKLCLPAGETTVIRGRAMDDKGHIYFSEPQAVQSRIGESKELEVKLDRARELRGVLDASVPRPVKKGRVMTSVDTPGPDEVLKLLWPISAEVKEDGSFVLQEIPRGIVRVIAICEGYISSRPQDMEKDRVWNAQTFPKNSDEPIRLAMEPTGSVRVKIKNVEGKPVGRAWLSCYLLFRFMRGDLCDMDDFPDNRDLFKDYDPNNRRYYDWSRGLQRIRTTNGLLDK